MKRMFFLISIVGLALPGCKKTDASDPAGSANGTFNGNTPTNDIWQNDYSLGTNQSITIPVLAMTKVMETSWGNEFVNNIRSSREYSFEIGGRLNIKTTNKTLTFQKL